MDMVSTGYVVNHGISVPFVAEILFTVLLLGREYHLVRRQAGRFTAYYQSLLLTPNSRVK